MNDWNKNYKPYGGSYDNYYREDSVWPAVLVLFAIILVPLGIYHGYRFYKYLNITYTGPQIIGSIVVGLFVFLIASSVVWAIANEVLKWWDSVFTGIDPISSQKNYNNGNIANNTAKTVYKPKPVKTWAYGVAKPILYAGDRKCPPRAEMFGRLDGEAIEALGKYEERWLSYREYDWWIEQNERKQLLEARLLDETVQKDPIVVNTTTKIDF